MSLRQPTGSPLRHRRPPTPLAEVRRADPQLRTIVVRVRAWALSVGRACSTDALTAVIGAAVDEGRAGVLSPLHWTATRVDEVLRERAPGFCAARDVALPDGLAAAMALWLEYLAAQGAFSAESEPLASLKAAARGAVDSGAERRSEAARHPAKGRRA